MRLLGYEPPFSEPVMRLVGKATRIIHHLTPTIALPASGIEQRKSTYIKMNTQTQAPPPMSFSLIPNVKVFGMDATSERSLVRKLISHFPHKL